MKRLLVRTVGAAVVALAIVVAPFATSAGAILPPLPSPVGPVINAVDDIVDAVLDIILGDPADIPGELEDFVTYQVHTVYPGPAGTIDKLTDAALLVPTPIDVDNDVTTGTGGNDVAVQLTIDAGRATLRVQTLPNAPSPLPLAVEGIMPDPRRTSDLRVAFGYDALADTAPAVYDATIALVGASRLSSFALDVTTVSPGSTLGVTAGVFDEGPNGERSNPQHGRIDFTPVPTVSHLNVLVGSDLGLTQSGVDFVVNTPTAVDLLLEDVSGDDLTQATGRIENVPQTMSLLLQSQASGAQNWTYRANARVGLIDLRVADTTGAAVNDDFQVRLEDLPLEMSLLSDSPTHSTFQSTSPVGVIEAGFAHGGAVDKLADPAYLYQKAEPGFDSLAFRVIGLSRAELSTADPTVLDLDMAPGPFHALIQDGNRTIDAMIRDLPSSIRAELSATGSSLSLEGNDRIGEIVVDAHDPDGLAGRATDLDLRLVDLPESVTFGYGTDGGSAGVEADGVIGSVDLLLTSGPTIAVDDGFDGIIMEETPDHFALVAELHGLTEASVTTGDAPYGITLRKDPGPFLAKVVQGDRDTRIEFLDLPDTLEATFNPAGSLALTASAPIAKITAVIDDPGGVSGRATHASALLEGVPTTLDVTWDTAGDAVGIDASGQTLDLLEVALNDGSAVALPAGVDGIILRDTAAEYGIAVRMHGLQLAQVSTGAAPYTIEIDKAPGPFIVDLTDGARKTDVEILDLPSSIDAVLDPAGSLSLTSSAPIGSIETTLTDPGGVGGRATSAHALLQDVPTTLAITWNAEGGEVGVDASGQTVGLIDVLLTSGPTISVPAGFDGVLLEDVADHYAVAIRLNQLQKAVVSTTGAPYTLDIKKQAGPFSIQLFQGTRTTDIKVLDLPSSFVATFNPAGSLSYTSSAAIGSVTASIVDTAGVVSGRATQVHATLNGLPTSLDVSWAGAGGALTADAHGQTLGKIEFFMTSGPTASLPASEDGIILRDTTAQYVVFGRITGLRKVTFAQGPPPSFTLNTTGGRIFRVDIDTQRPGGVATTDAVINVLPTDLTVAMGTGANFSYTASGAVASVVLTIFDPNNISGRAKNLNATLTGLPTRLDVSTATNGTITADAFGGTVGLVEFLLTSGPVETIATSQDGLLLNDLADRYVMFARLTGLKRAVGSTSPAPNINLQTTAGRPFRLELNKLNGTKVEYNRATLNNLPSSVVLAVNGQNISYTASGPASLLSFDTNVGNRWNTHADISNPVPASFTVCVANDVSCTPVADRSGSAARSADASFRFVASELTTVNMFDCVAPANATCPASPDQFTRITNLRVKVLGQDGRTTSAGDAGHIYVDTDSNSLNGQIHTQQGSSGFRETFSGFSSNNRLGRWTGYGLPLIGSNTKSGSVTCGGTSLEVRFIFWIGVTGFLC